MPSTREAAIQAHRSTVESSLADVTAFLQDALGQRLVAFISGAENPKTVGRWAKGQRPHDTEVERKLRDTHQIFQLLLSAESPYTVRAWFVGLNPQLDDESPAAAIRDGRTRDALIAARAFLAGG